MSIRGLLVVVAALSALLLAAGCGDSDDSATGSSDGGSADVTVEEVNVETGSLSKAAFVKRVQPLCQQAKRGFEQALLTVTQAQMEKPRKPTEISAEQEYYEEEFGEPFEKLADQITAMGAPSGSEEEVAAYLEGIQKGIAEAAEDPEGFTQPFLEAEASFEGTSQPAKALGLIGCP